MRIKCHSKTFYKILSVDFAIFAHFRLKMLPAESILTLTLLVITVINITIIIAQLNV